MKIRVVFVILIVSIFAVGCAPFDKRKDQTAGLLNPPKLHGAYDKDNAAYKAAQVPIDDYYHALDLAKSTYTVDSSGKTTAVTIADQNKIKNYVSEGIGLTDAYCRRWFQSLDDMQRLLAFEDKNVNVISQLGTTLLGIGKANANIVTGYGASNTAYAGFSENFNSAFLVAPTAAKVREHIESAMKAEAVQLRTDSASLNFKEAYTRLERYASFCTYAQAKEIVNTALSLTKTELNATTRQPETVKK
jgi:hypothetical protein